MKSFKIFFKGYLRSVTLLILNVLKKSSCFTYYFKGLYILQDYSLFETNCKILRATKIMLLVFYELNIKVILEC